MPHSTAEEGAALTAWYQTLLMGSLRSEALESALADLPRPCPAAWPADFLLWLVLKSYSVWPDCPDLLTLFAPAARPGLLQQTGLIVYLPEITPAARQRLLTALKDELPDLQTESAAETWAELAVALSASGASAAADALWLALQQHALKKGPRQKTWTVLTYLLCNSRTHWPPVLQHWRRQWPRQHARKLAFLEATVYDLNWLTLCTFQLQPELEPLRPALDALVQLLWRGLQQLQAATPTTEALALDASRLQQRLLGQAIHWELPCAKAWLDTLGYTTPLDWLSDTHQLWEHQDLLTPLTAAELARLARALPDPDAETDTASSRWQLLACLAQSHLPIAPTAEAQSLAPLSTRHLKARWRHLQAELAQLQAELGQLQQPQAGVLFGGLQSLQQTLQPLWMLEQALAEVACPFWDWLQARLRPAALAGMDNAMQKYWLQALRGLQHLNLPARSQFTLQLAEAHLLARAGRSAWPALKACLAHLHQHLLTAPDGLDFLQDFSRLARDLSQPVFDTSLRQRVFAQLARWIPLADATWHHSLWQNLVHMLARAGEMPAALLMLQQVQPPQERLDILGGIPTVLSEAGDRTLYPAYLEALSALADELPAQAVPLRCQAAWAWALRGEPERGLKVLKLLC